MFLNICSIGRIITNQMKYNLPADISSEAKNFIKLLLEFDQEKRPSADEALELPYIISLSPTNSSPAPNSRNEISTNLQKVENVKTIENSKILIMENKEKFPPFTTELKTAATFEETLRLLRQLKLEPNEIYGNTVIDSRRNTILLHYVCEKGDAKILKELLQQKNCDLECRALGFFGQDSGRTPMHFAALKGNDECLKYLIEAKANLNSKDNFKFTPSLFFYFKFRPSLFLF